MPKPLAPVTRAPLSKDVSLLRESLQQVIPLLESQSHWYGSVLLKRSSSSTVVVNQRQERLSDGASLGAVLRIYDGYTLHEEATDQISPAALEKAARNMVARIRRKPRGNSRAPRYYEAPKWTERLARPLDEEIRSQIPLSPGPETHVHFGIQFRRDPVLVTQEQRTEHLRSLISKASDTFKRSSMNASSTISITATDAFRIEETLFLDRETQLSQTIFRISIELQLAVGKHSVSVKTGGLGGTEVTEVADSEIEDAIKNLEALSCYETLKPGKYRVLLSPHVSGLLAHEALGHAQEGDTCARGRSRAWTLFKQGTSIGNEHATIYNNPGIFRNGTRTDGAWGSYFFDDEGWLAEKQLLLDQGRLSAPMANLTTSLRLGIPRTSNGRRASWTTGIYARQSNTYFSPGSKTLRELLSELDTGYLATASSGGMEDPKGFGIQVGILYLLEVVKGKVTGRAFLGPSGASILLTGYVPDILQSIVAKSKIDAESELPDQAETPENVISTGCFKYFKDPLHVGFGGPYILLDQVTLG